MHRLYQSILLIFIIILPIVSASSLTGSFSDYGIDTDSDSSYNFLTVKVGVSVTSATVDYIVYGILEDSANNSIEASECRHLPVGTYNFTLNFSGISLYKNKVNGPYNLQYVELNQITSCNGSYLPTFISSLDYPYTTSYYAYTQFDSGKPAIYCTNSSCIAGSDLIRSRDNISITPEPNASNTVDGCQDGSSGSYLASESIENITVTSLNYTFFKPGSVVMVDAWVYCDSTYDNLNFVYSSNISNSHWFVKKSVACPGTGLRKLSANFTLDNNTGQHAVRGVFSFFIENTAVCSEDAANSAPYWGDNDDLVIYVKECQSNTDCPAVDCDYLDGCVGQDYYNYSDVYNTCLANYVCGQGAVCGAPTIISNDSRCAASGYKLALNQGWNLVSLPKINNKSITEIAKLFGNFERIVTLKNSTWYAYDKEYAQNSNLYELSEAQGFWIKMNQTTNVSIGNESAANVTFNLTKGWNLIGYPSLQVQYANNLFQNVSADVELVFIFNSSNNSYKSYSPNLTTNFTILPGTGMFVKLKNNATWHFDGRYIKNGAAPNISSNITSNISLIKGWNLISLALQPANTSIPYLIRNLSGRIIIWHYNSTANNWTVYDTAAPLQMNSLQKISYGNAYWLNSTLNQTLSVQGSIVGNHTIRLVSGWNFVGFNSSTTAISNATSRLATPIIVWAYYTGGWKVYDTGSLPDTLTNMTAGKGYWIKSSVNQNWTI